ncbi:MAG: hypothetical protein IH884_12880, partial [Myxococcales bacterium]|nr:hypothetical protein [Myxococcales bacterium]
MRIRRVRLAWVAWIASSALLLSCSNNPYPGADDTVKVRYGALPSAPKTLDPAVTYSSLE